MASRLIAEYLTPTGAVVSLTEKTLLGLFDLTYIATCGSCGADTTETTSYTPAAIAQARAIGWAEEHATACRRIAR